MKCEISAKLQISSLSQLLDWAFGLSLGGAYLGVILVLSGVFYAWIIWSYAILAILAFLIVIAINRRSIFSSANFMKVGLIAVLIVFLAGVGYFSAPNIFSGRDQGSITEAAIKLSQNHNLDFSTEISKDFFQFRGPGKALNFPGFNYDQSGNLISQFPIGYTVWLAFFFSLFGFKGLVIANLVSFFVFALSFYLFIRKFAPSGSAILGMAAMLASFVFMWFLKFSLGENLALMLLWFAILKFDHFFREKSSSSLCWFIGAMGYLLLVRIETVAFLAVAMLIYFLFSSREKKIEKSKPAIFVSIFVATVILAAIILNFSSYLEFAKSALKPYLMVNSVTAPNMFFEFIYVMKVFAAYSLTLPLVLGVAGIIYFFYRKNWASLIPFGIVAPSFAYLFSANVSLDHPWMLRRYLFSLLPAVFFYMIISIQAAIKKKHIRYFILVIVIASNLWISPRYFTFVPEKGLEAGVKVLAEKFSSRDLVLVDRLASGNQWAMISGPLSFVYGKQAVYFFDPTDLEKLDSGKYENIYFIIADPEFGTYAKNGIAQRLAAVSEYRLSYDEIGVQEVDKSKITRLDVNLPPVEKRLISGKVYKLTK